MTLRVDVATGATVLAEVDLRLPGFLPLVLARTYRSDGPDAGPLGPGWRLNVDVALEVGPERLVVHGVLERPVAFAPVAEGVQATHHETGLVLQHHPGAYVAFFSPLAGLVFPKTYAAGGRLRLGCVEDRSGNRLACAYHDGRLAGLTDSAGRTLHFAYHGGRLTGVHLGSGRGAALVRQYAYDASGDLVAARDAAGRETRYGYDGHLLVACTDRAGRIHYAEYDADRRCLTRWTADGRTVRRFDYDPALGTTRVLADDGRQTLYRHADGRVLLRVDAEGAEQGFLYDERGRLMGYTDTAGELAALRRLDPEARTLTVMAGGRRVWTAGLGAHGLAETLTVGAFGPFALAYNEAGHLTSVTAPTGGRWTIGRDRRGAAATVTTPAGRGVSLAHDPDGRALSIEGPDGPRLRARFEAAGLLAERHDGLGRAERRAYDAEGRLVAVARDGGYEVRFGYDPAGRLVGVRDTDGYETTRRRDGDGWTRAPERPPAGLSAEVVAGLAGEPLRRGPEADAAYFAYDAAGGLTAVDRSGHRLTVTRDADGLAVAVHDETNDAANDAAAREVTIRRDGRGRPVEVVPGGAGAATGDGAPGGVRCTYDAAGRLATVHRPGAAPLALRYDACDRLAAARHTLTADAPALALVTGQRGVVLVAACGDVDVPLWAQGAVPFGPPAPHDVLLHGAGAVLAAPAPAPEALLAAWRAAGRRWLYGDLPAAHDLGVPLPLDGWPLRRAVYDSAYPDGQPLHTPAARPDPHRAPDDLVAGAHRHGTPAPIGPVPLAGPPTSAPAAPVLITPA